MKLTPLFSAVGSVIFLSTCNKFLKLLFCGLTVKWSHTKKFLITKYVQRSSKIRSFWMDWIDKLEPTFCWFPTKFAKSIISFRRVQLDLLKMMDYHWINSNFRGETHKFSRNYTKTDDFGGKEHLRQWSKKSITHSKFVWDWWWSLLQ